MKTYTTVQEKLLALIYTLWCKQLFKPLNVCLVARLRYGQVCGRPGALWGL
jgi:hypothetical protein